MLKFSLWGRLLALCLAMLLASCGGGGGNGSSADAPTGFTVTPGNGQVTVTWNAVAGVDYWLMYAAGSTPIDMKDTTNPHTWALSITSPYVVSSLSNGTAYSFAMNARTGGGPGGPQTASVTVTPGYAGTTWVAGTGAAGTLNGVAYGTSSADSLAYFVAVGDGGGIYKTADSVIQGVTGYTWSQVTGGPTSDFKAATYAYGQYVAVGVNLGASYIASSPDLANWTSAILPGTPGTGFSAVASNGTTLVAVGKSGRVYYSNDALNWLASTVTGTFSGSDFYGVAYSTTNSAWVAVGAGGALISSSDGGVTWSTPPAYSSVGIDLKSVAITSGNIFVAVGAGGAVLRSTDGSTWSLQTPSPITTLYAVSTDSTQFVAVGAGGKEFTSPDGVTWTAALTNGTNTDLLGVIGSASKYVAVGLAGATVSSIH